MLDPLRKNLRAADDEGERLRLDGQDLVQPTRQERPSFSRCDVGQDADAERRVDGQGLLGVDAELRG